MRPSLALGLLFCTMGCASLKPIPPCDQLPLPEDVTPPARVEFFHPQAPRDGTTYGFACVEATVDLDGRVVDPVVLKTNHPAFAESFLETLRQWRYEPARKEGEAVEVRVTLSSSFETRTPN